jgi:hypothetical protein
VINIGQFAHQHHPLLLLLAHLKDSGCTPGTIGFVDTTSDTDYLNDLLVFFHYNINTNDISEVMNPLKPRMTRPSDIDYESKRKYFAHLPASVVKATFEHTTQNMRLPPSTYLHKVFKSPNPSADLKRRDEADATDQIFRIRLLSTVERKVHICLPERNQSLRMLSNQKITHLQNF